MTRTCALLTLLAGGCTSQTPAATDSSSAAEDTHAAAADDTSTAPADDTADPFCAEAPVVTWNNFGNGFLRESCQGCHASTTANRYGAPEAVTFDTVEQAWSWSARILARSGVEDPTMPPAGGVREEDRLLLVYWLTCATPGT